MSKLQNILEDLSKYIQEHYQGVQVYFDDSQMDPNIELPAISFQVGEMKESASGCSEYQKELEIRLHTSTLDKSQLLSELWDFEENIIHIIKEGNKTGSITEEEAELRYLKTHPIGALVYAQEDKDIFFSNILRVGFELRYTI